ncbi:MAG: VapC toxin family PIN domain ribonuclease [Methylobacter sp.]|nr:MAG: VapC toxin family PIN domain ribonuclease [Methylobacter sp.]
MKRYLLDTSALLTLRDNEAGANQVADILYQAQEGKSLCFGCFMSLMEVLYRVWKDESEQAGRLAYRQCLSLPIKWLHEHPALLEKAAEIKATHSLSLADAWIAASALLQGAVLVHKDPEFVGLACQQLELPYKKTI